MRHSICSGPWELIKDIIGLTESTKCINGNGEKVRQGEEVRAASRQLVTATETPTNGKTMVARPRIISTAWSFPNGLCNFYARGMRMCTSRTFMGQGVPSSVQQQVCHTTLVRINGCACMSHD